MSSVCRRQALLEVLCERRHESIANLAFEFKVSIRTIKYDIEELALSYPIYTTQGNGGGVHIMDGYRLGMKYFTASQTELLERISKNLTGADLKTAQTILATFRQPKGKPNGN